MSDIFVSVNEIASYAPCSDGFKRLLEARKFSGEYSHGLKDGDKKFTLSSVLTHCVFSDITWLLANRNIKAEQLILSNTAKKCAASVLHYKNKQAADAAAYAYAYADAAAAAAAAAAYAAAADAAYAAAADAAYAADAAADASKKQRGLNLSFLRQELENFNSDESTK